MRAARVFVFLLSVLLMLGAALPVFAQQTHIVQYGETLQSIAQRYRITPEALAQVNGIANPNLIYPGQSLVIAQPGIQPSQGSIIYTVQYGDTLTSVAQRYSVTLERLVAINPVTETTALRVGETLIIPPESPVIDPDAPLLLPTATPVPPPVLPPVNRVYIVQPGDTMFRISRLYGVNVYRIAEANGILNLNLIYAGQHLVIP